MSESYTEVPETTEQLNQLENDTAMVEPGVQDPIDGGYSPPDKPSVLMRGHDSDDTLDARLSQEEPEVWEEPATDDYVDDGEVGGDRAGRLVEPNQGIGADTDSDLIASDVGIDGAAASAEEAAMHVIPDGG